MKDLGMGKYMKKSNKASEVSEMEDPHQKPYLFDGVLTRAKTLALKKLGLLPAESPAPEDGGSYIQLRSRRLERPSLGKKQKKRRGPTKARARAEAVEEEEEKVGSGSGGVGSGQLGGEIQEKAEEESVGLGSQGSVGGNALAFQENAREEREATPCSLPRHTNVPCSLPRDTNVIRTPGSTTRAGNSTEDNGIVLNPVRVQYPTAHEVDAFFSGAEELQRKEFIEKYNFDPVEEKPLPGRYEWVKVDP